MKHYGDELQSVISQLLRVRAVSVNKVKTAKYAAQSLRKNFFHSSKCLILVLYILGVIRDKNCKESDTVDIILVLLRKHPSLLKKNNKILGNLFNYFSELTFIASKFF